MRVLAVFFLLGCAVEEPGNPVVPDDGVTRVMPAQPPPRAEAALIPDGGLPSHSVTLDMGDRLSHVCRDKGDIVRCADQWCDCVPSEARAPLSR